MDVHRLSPFYRQHQKVWSMTVRSGWRRRWVPAILLLRASSPVTIGIVRTALFGISPGEAKTALKQSAVCSDVFTDLGTFGIVNAKGVHGMYRTNQPYCSLGRCYTLDRTNT